MRKECYLDMDPELAPQEILDETLPEIHTLARDFLRDLGSVVQN